MPSVTSITNPTTTFIFLSLLTMKSTILLNNPDRPRYSVRADKQICLYGVRSVLERNIHAECEKRRSLYVYANNPSAGFIRVVASRKRIKHRLGLKSGRRPRLPAGPVWMRFGNEFFDLCRLI